MSVLCVLILLLLSSTEFVLSKLPSTLVVVEDDFSKYEYSRFFKSLKRRGHKLSIKSSGDKSIKLTEYGESLYNNLIILSPSSKQIGDLSYKDILTFIDNGNNLFIGINEKYSNDFIKKIADRCGIDIHTKTSNVYDHLNYDLLRNDNSLNNNIILLSNWPKYKGIISSSTEIPSAPVLYKGIGMTLKKNSHLTLSLLSGNLQTYSIDNNNPTPIDKSIIKSGNQLSLISALQMRNNARITFIGSLKMLSDEFSFCFFFEIYRKLLLSIITTTNRYFISPIKSSKDGKEYKKSGNEEFIALISAWSFGERGILRVTNVTHHQQKQDNDKDKDNDDNKTTINPTRYRIKDLVTYSVFIEEYRLSCDCYIPFKQNDVQFEFIRLDAFIRQFMKHDNNGNYQINFMLPDVFGIYKFTINYKRKGWGYINTEKLVSVRPFRHDEYQRFLITAYPYYLGTASMIIGFIIFTFVFLFGTVKKRKIW